MQKSHLLSQFNFLFLICIFAFLSLIFDFNDFN